MAEAEEEKKEKKDDKDKKDKKDKGKGEEDNEKAALGGLLKNKKVLGIIAAVVILVGGGAFFFLKGGDPPTEGADGEAHVEEVADANGEKKADKKGEAKPKKDAHGGTSNVSGGSVSTPTLGSNLKLAPFIVNLRDNSGRRYLKLSITLELASSSSAVDIEMQEAKIRDSVIVLLSSKSYAEIGTVEGKYQLRDEIVLRINQFLDDKPVKTAYFTEFVIQ
jgi:flagellar FliL protein